MATGYEGAACAGMWWWLGLGVVVLSRHGLLVARRHGALVDGVTSVRKQHVDCVLDPLFHLTLLQPIKRQHFTF
jgi:hypothetical protein